MHRLLLAAVFVLPTAPVRAQSVLDDLFTPPAGSFLASDEPLLGPLQDREIGAGWIFSAGGELRSRYMDEENRLRPPLAAGRSTYSQFRFTPYADLRYEDLVEFRVQAIDASTFGNELPQAATDENRTDLLQYYVDVNLLDTDNDGSLHLKLGRQFMHYGSGHLVAPAPWSNTFRNFEGARLYYTDPDWDLDAFAVRPVNASAGNFFRPYSYDTPDQSRWLSGVYTSYKQAPAGAIDLYWLWLKEDDDMANVIDGNRHTFGLRYAGKLAAADAGTPMSWLWDLEGTYQVGKEDFLTGKNQDVRAGSVAASGGVGLDDLPWAPEIVGIYYLGSGDSDPGDGTNNTFNTHFPLGHRHWGLIDNVTGQNLVELGLRVTVKPAERLTLLSGFHWFRKASREDAIYNGAGAPFGGAVPTASNDIGNELNLVATWQINKNLQLQSGYFWFWYGDAVSQHPNPLVAHRGDARQFYTHVDWTF